jgi:hypothetical protein
MTLNIDTTNHFVMYKIINNIVDIILRLHNAVFVNTHGCSDSMTFIATILFHECDKIIRIITTQLLNKCDKIIPKYKYWKILFT